MISMRMKKFKIQSLPFNQKEIFPNKLSRMVWINHSKNIQYIDSLLTDLSVQYQFCFRWKTVVSHYILNFGTIFTNDDDCIYYLLHKDDVISPYFSFDQFISFINTQLIDYLEKYFPYFFLKNNPDAWEMIPMNYDGLKKIL